MGGKDVSDPGSPAVPAGEGCVLGPRNLTAQFRAQASHANPAPVYLSPSFSSSINANKGANFLKGRAEDHAESPQSQTSDVHPRNSAGTLAVSLMSSVASLV